MNDVVLMFGETEDVKRRKEDVALIFKKSSCCNAGPVDLAQQVQIEKNKNDILDLRNAIQVTNQRLEEKIITGTTLKEEQQIGDYYILQGNTIKEVKSQNTKESTGGGTWLEIGQ